MKNKYKHTEAAENWTDENINVFVLNDTTYNVDGVVWKLISRDEVEPDDKYGMVSYKFRNEVEDIEYRAGKLNCEEYYTCWSGDTNRSSLARKGRHEIAALFACVKIYKLTY